jgi:hypothetical protein
MPRTRLSGALSSDAVDSFCDSAFTRLVLPLSTWPSTPRLMLRILLKSISSMSAIAAPANRATRMDRVSAEAT